MKGEIVDVITKMKGLLAPELVKKINATFDFELTGRHIDPLSLLNTMF